MGGGMGSESGQRREQQPFFPEGRRDRMGTCTTVSLLPMRDVLSLLPLAHFFDKVPWEKRVGKDSVSNFGQGRCS